MAICTTSPPLPDTIMAEVEVGVRWRGRGVKGKGYELIFLSTTHIFPLSQGEEEEEEEEDRVRKHE